MGAASSAVVQHGSSASFPLDPRFRGSIRDQAGGFPLLESSGNDTFSKGPRNSILPFALLRKKVFRREKSESESLQGRAKEGEQASRSKQSDPFSLSLSLFLKKSTRCVCVCVCVGGGARGTVPCHGYHCRSR